MLFRSRIQADLSPPRSTSESLPFYGGFGLAFGSTIFYGAPILFCSFCWNARSGEKSSSSCPLFFRGSTPFLWCFFPLSSLTGEVLERACSSFGACWGWAVLNLPVRLCCILPASTPLISFWPFYSAPVYLIPSKTRSKKSPRRRQPLPVRSATAFCWL